MIENLTNRCYRVWVISLSLCLYCFDVYAEDRRVQLTTELSIDSFSTITGGNDTGTSLFALLDMGLEVPLIAGVTAHVNAFFLGGENPSINAGDFNALDNNAGEDGVRLFRAYLAKEFIEQSVLLHIGKLAVDDEFMLSDYAALFINSGFGILPTVSGNAAIPNFPLSGLGLFSRYSMGDSAYFQVGVYDGNTGSETSNQRGLNNALSGDDGLAIFTEIARHTYFAELAGVWKLGGYCHSGEFEDFTNGTMTDSNYSLYVSVDQALSQDGEQTQIGVFYRAGYSPTNDRNVVSFYNDLGIVISGFLWQRPQDQLGLAFSYTHFSDDFTDNQRLSGSFHTDHETVLELTYKINVFDGLTLVPDMQYILSPATGDNDVLVMGARLELAY